MPCDVLRELALCYERHPESMRTVPWLRPAGGDSVPLDPLDPGNEFQIDSFRLWKSFGDRPFFTPNMYSLIG